MKGRGEEEKQCAAPHWFSFKSQMPSAELQNEMETKCRSESVSPDLINLVVFLVLIMLKGISNILKCFKEFSSHLSLCYCLLCFSVPFI